MKSPEALAVYHPRVLKNLKDFISGHSEPEQAWQADAVKRLEALAVRGKLMRGCLVCYSYELCSGQRRSKLPEQVIGAAVAIEMIHCGLLIHDDIIDGDELRRGRPAVHVQYRSEARRRQIGQAGRLGESLALCAGDMAILMAFEALAAGKIQDSELVSFFARRLTTVSAGQMQDTFLGNSAACPSKHEIYRVMRSKTAAYSVALPLVAGAILAGLAKTMRNRLDAIGIAAGTIFQIRDDELGIFGRPEAIGKPVGSDIREGKKTLLYYYIWQAAGKRERERLTTIFGNSKAAQADIDYVRRSMKRYNVQAKLQTDIKRLEKTAYGHIEKLPLNAAAKQELKQMVRFCAARKF